MGQNMGQNESNDNNLTLDGTGLFKIEHPEKKGTDFWKEIHFLLKLLS